MATLELLDQVESWLAIVDRANYYELLGILEIADDDAIQRAFHEFSQSFHPDLYRSEPSELVSAITTIYQRGAEAYGVLRDPKLRAKYDLALSQGALRYTPGLTTQSVSPQGELDLAHLARTKGGQLHARQLERAIAEGDLERAKGLLDRVMLAEGTHPELVERAQRLMELVRSGRLTPG